MSKRQPYPFAEVEMIVRGLAKAGPAVTHECVCALCGGVVPWSDEREAAAIVHRFSCPWPSSTSRRTEARRRERA